jgi:Bacterial SH3 domain
LVYYLPKKIAKFAASSHSICVSMSEKRGSVLPKIELLFFVGLFLAFGIWGTRQCNRTREQYRQNAENKRIRHLEDSLGIVIQRQKDSTQQARNRQSATPAPNTAPSMPRLYVSIQGLKVRQTPKLNAQIVESLNLYDEVLFLGEVTDSTQTINLGKETVSEPWVKIQTPRGRAGWVFGAGVHYYRRKHPGAE